jgi:hypothetical protein
VREDLEGREYAESLGWTVVYSDTDRLYKRTGTTLSTLPNDPVKFRRELPGGGSRMVWPLYEVLNDDWMAADISAEGNFEKLETRRRYETLKGALEKEDVFCRACSHRECRHDEGGCHAPNYDDPSRECDCIGLDW